MLNRFFISLILISSIYYFLFFLTLHLFILFIFLFFILSIYEWYKINKIIFFNTLIFIIYLFFFVLFYEIFFSYLFVYIIFFSKIINLLSLIWCFLLFLLVIFYPKSSFFWKNSNILKTLFGFLIFIPLFFDLIFIRQLFYEKNFYYGSCLLLYILIPVWCFDSMSYICGILFGIHKLSPNISPGKTFEGYIGGLCSLFFICFLYKFLGLLNINNFTLCIISFIISILCLFGDLSESMFKRIGNVKDSSNLFFSHGGLLDRIDSLTIIIPLFSNYLLFLQVY